MSNDFVVMHEDPLERVRLAVDDLRAGKMVILVDDEDRENEGDLVVAAEACTPAVINFMATHGRGLICLSITGDQVQRLGLPMMATNNQSAYGTAFTVSIEAREGVSTGISASDRAHTVQVAIQADATPRSVVTPGHMFPLRARDGGVLERVGQTEGSVDLSRMAGMLPAAVICEIIRDDGEMARLPDLITFGQTHGIRVATVADIIKHRMRHERVVHAVSRGTLDVPGLGTWNTALYRGETPKGLHLAMWRGELSAEPTPVRVQAAPPAWSFLDAGASRLAVQARAAMSHIVAHGSGAVVFMHVGGTSVDVLERQFGRDFLGHSDAPAQAAADALRDLGMGCQVLADLGLRQLKLLTTSRRPIVGVEAYGLAVAERILLDA
jgi:3,4-dihydroxy 2-butanone 4-phosphate synthase/GTP cyclohydrolase II